MEKRRAGTTIRARIVRTIVAIGLVPLVVLGAVVVVSLQGLSADVEQRLEQSRAALTEQVGTAGLEEAARDIADDIDSFLRERVRDVQVWASDPLVRSAAADATREAERLDLEERSAAELDERYRDDPSLGTSPEAADYLVSQQRVAGVFADLSFTDAHGYNVASTTKTADFVQNDELWWQSAWAKGLDIGSIVYDESSQVHSTDVAVRIDGPDGSPAGVLKASADIAAVQEIADRRAQGRSVTVLDESGLLIAETVTRHDRARIMVPDVVYAETLDPPVARSVEHAKLRGGSSVITETKAVGVAATGRTPAASDDFVSFGWVVLVEQPTEIAFAPLTPISEVGRRLSNASLVLTILVVLVAVLAGVAAVAVALPLARRIVSPILRLRDVADGIATTELPELVESIDRLQPGEQLPALEPIAVRTGDEVEQLADKFNSVVSTATRLAAEQVESRRQNLSDAFVSMGRRNQKLVGRQLRVLDDLERHESDPDTLSGLFKVDHLATRMRRNAESLLVLAGHEPPRTWSRRVAMRDVVRSAASEVEDYARINAGSIEPAYVRGNVVSEVAHLLAELLENATAFSAPDTTVEVIGRARGGDYRLTVVDQGIGMSETELGEANHKLANPEAFNRAPSQYLGLFVIGRLAARLGIEVLLFESAGGGVIARVTLSESLLDTGAGAGEPGEDQPVDLPLPAPARPAMPPVTPVTPVAPVAPLPPFSPMPPVPAPTGSAEPPVVGPGSRFLSRDPSTNGTGDGDPVTPLPLRGAGVPSPLGGPPEGGVEYTPSGFRVRQRKAPGALHVLAAPTPAVPPLPVRMPVRIPAPPRAPAPVSPRSAEQVRSSLSSIMAGVKQGRNELRQANESDEPPSREDRS